MLLNKAIENTNKWSQLLNAVKYEKKSPYQCCIQFANQLEIDLENYNANLEVTDCAYWAPRIGGKLDKKTKIAKNIAYMISNYTEDQLEDENIRQRAYINYARIIDLLVIRFRHQLQILKS